MTSHNFDHRVLFIVFSHILPNSIKNIVRERPFNLKGGGGGGGGGGLWFYSKKNILIPNVAEKNILILVEEKKIIWFRVFVI